MSEVPISCMAFFFDDVRLEAGNKMSFMGQYTGELVLSDLGESVDRLVLLVRAQWRQGWKPTNIGIKIQMPDQSVIELPVPPNLDTRSEQSEENEFAFTNLQGVTRLRFSTLKDGDQILVWIRIDDRVLPAGRLRVKGPEATLPAS